MTVIMLNMIAMGLEHYEQSEEFKAGLSFVNTVFIVIFTLECIMKIIGLRWFYFKQPWNVFDFVVVVFSIFGKWIYMVFTAVFDWEISPPANKTEKCYDVRSCLLVAKSVSQ